jgi:uncharacterized protein (DUF1778 family)
MKNTTFVLLNPKLAGFSFNGYLDKDGDTKFITSHKDTNGNPVYRRFKWPRGSRSFVIPGAQKEVIEFFRNSPFCEGSPIAMSKPYFKELDLEKDAELVVEDESRRILAQAAALKLEGKRLKDVALLCGYDGPSDKLQRQKVLSYAKNSPVVFMELLDSKTLDVEVLFTNGLTSGILKRKGFLFYFDDVVLGNSKDKVIGRLMEEADLRNAISERLNKK